MSPKAELTRLALSSPRPGKFRYLRLEEAKQHLETGTLPIEAVSSEVGYEDASFFSRLFRRSVGMTPAAYRRRFAGLRKAMSP
ncbi:helix-turn-helix domain-containing protein [Mesorhizobium onobrychidis]|uniref:Helix-turn-helix domain-containing protein n=1 Tax=Mesorhizobium onobrychidis TaxID=2775404 RepID=A0ABY5R2R2_9HYPH|nr:helix-turn-helix domain-containing protein [Mesorhizobium onobrychidis]